MGPAKKNKHKLGKAITIPSTSDKAWKHVDPFSGDPEVKLNDFCQKNDLKYTFNNTRKGVFGDSHYAALKLDGNFYAEQFPVFELETPAGSAKKAKAACARLALEYLASTPMPSIILPRYEEKEIIKLAAKVKAADVPPETIRAYENYVDGKAQRLVFESKRAAGVTVHAENVQAPLNASIPHKRDASDASLSSCSSSSSSEPQNLSQPRGSHKLTDSEELRLEAALQPLAHIIMSARTEDQREAMGSFVGRMLLESCSSMADHEVGGYARRVMVGLSSTVLERRSQNIKEDMRMARKTDGFGIAGGEETCVQRD